MTERSASWRIISSPAADGAANMAIDEAILEAVRQGQSPPTLRLYTWKPACLSIGRFQRAGRSADFDALASRGYDFVRRPTGGRAVLHDNELTYAVIANADDLAAVGDGINTGAGVLHTYLALSRGLAAGMARMGISVVLAPRDAGGVAAGGSAACFDSPSAYELTAAGRKIVGSAQVRRGSSFLQHGSIPLWMDFAAVEAVMGLPPGSGSELSRRVATVGEFTPGFSPNADSARILAQLAEAITAGLVSEVMKNALPGQLTQAELELASQLDTRYRSQDWNLSR